MHNTEDKEDISTEYLTELELSQWLCSYILFILHSSTHKIFKKTEMQKLSLGFFYIWETLAMYHMPQWQKHWSTLPNTGISPLEVLLQKGVLKMCSKFTGKSHFGMGVLLKVCCFYNITLKALKVHSQVWDNFWQLKAV